MRVGTNQTNKYEISIKTIDSSLKNEVVDFFWIFAARRIEFLLRRTMARPFEVHTFTWIRTIWTGARFR